MYQPLVLVDVLNRRHKTCPSCGYFLTFEKFWHDKAKADGLNSYCKKCDRKRKKLGFKVGD